MNNDYPLPPARPGKGRWIVLSIFGLLVVFLTAVFFLRARLGDDLKQKKKIYLPGLSGQSLPDPAATPPPPPPPLKQPSSFVPPTGPASRRTPPARKNQRLFVFKDGRAAQLFKASTPKWGLRVKGSIDQLNAVLV